MITKEDIKAGVKLKLLCSRGRVLKGKGIRSAGTVITIKSVDTANNGFEDTDGHVYRICDLKDFDLVPSVLPTDRPLTYDETQMLQAGDVVRGDNLSFTVEGVCPNKITDLNSHIPWSLNEKAKSTQGHIYFVSRPEVKEEKRYEVKDDFKTSTFLGVPIHAGNVWTASTATGYDYGSSHKKVEQALNALNEKAKVKTTKSVSQILYGR